MKKSIFTIAILLSIFSVVFTSCNKDDDDPVVDDLTGRFEFKIDGVMSKSGTSAEIGFLPNEQGNYEDLITIGNDEISIVVSGIPRTTGGTVNIDGGDPGISIVVGQDLYTTVSGTLTRTSASKISFNGKCAKLLESQEYTITGYVDSDAWKVIK